MNKFLLFILLAVSTFTAQAQWSAPVQLGNGLFSSIASDNNTTLHMAYGDGAINYIRSTDEGTTWSNPVIIGSGTLYYDKPIYVDGMNVYVVYFRDFIVVSDWCCSRKMGNMYLRKSMDGGITWQPEIQLTTSQKGYRVSICAVGSDVYLTWMDYRSGNTWDIYFRKSVDGGATWSSELKLVSGINSFGEERPDLVVAGNSVHVFWMGALDNLPTCPIPGTGANLPFCSEVFYKRSLDGGNTWGAETRLDTGDAYDGRPIATIVNSDTIVVCWEGVGTNELEPFTRRSTDNGTTWSPIEQRRNNTGHASHPWITSIGIDLHLAWYDSRNPSNQEIYYTASHDAGATWTPEELVSNYPGSSQAPILAATSNYVHALWADDRSGTFEPWYSRRGSSMTNSVSNNIPNNQIDFKVYPNPAQQIFIVEFPKENFDLLITDISGSIIYEKKNIFNKIQIDSKCFAEGIYFVQITNGKNILNKKIIISM